MLHLRMLILIAWYLIPFQLIPINLIILFLVQKNILLQKNQVIPLIEETGERLRFQIIIGTLCFCTFLIRWGGTDSEKAGHA